mmetsp:Transcript_3620/g.9880  ORF Transcript_3620/g.9880 Transcript_3620/m.9880 type:complete len:129 (+) Transcript_3620:73-459(+)
MLMWGANLWRGVGRRSMETYMASSYVLHGSALSAVPQRRTYYYYSIPMDIVKERLVKVMRRHPEIRDDVEFNAEIRFKEDLKLDSLGLTELVMHVEDEFRVEITDEQVANMKTLDDLTSFFVAHPSAQ